MKLTYKQFREMTPEQLSNRSDEELYAAAVASKKLSSGRIRVAK